MPPYSLPVGVGAQPAKNFAHGLLDIGQFVVHVIHVRLLNVLSADVFSRVQWLKRVGGSDADGVTYT